MTRGEAWQRRLFTRVFVPLMGAAVLYGAFVDARDWQACRRICAARGSADHHFHIAHRSVAARCACVRPQRAPASDAERTLPTGADVVDTP